MTTLREAAQQALEAMLNFPDDISDEMFESIAALKAALVEDAMQKFTDVNQELEAALEEPVQEPVCDKDPRGCYSVRCQLGRMCKHAATPQRQAEPVGRCEDCGMKYCECGERK